MAIAEVEPAERTALYRVYGGRDRCNGRSLDADGERTAVNRLD